MHDLTAKTSLFTCIVTESATSAGGGLCFAETPNSQSHKPLAEFYQSCFGINTSNRLLPLLASVKRHTVVQMACGGSLQYQGVPSFQEWLNKWEATCSLDPIWTFFNRIGFIDEVIAFANKNIYPAKLHGFLVNLHSLLYFKGEPMRKALPESWARDERSREHSDLVVFRPGTPPETFIWSPQNRPLGCYLPDLRVFCACPNARWRHNSSTPHKEQLSKHTYRCTSCKSRLVVIVTWDHSFDSHHQYGTTYLDCQWPPPAPQVESKFIPFSDLTCGHPWYKYSRLW
jgi:hypothetical protein